MQQSQVMSREIVCSDPVEAIKIILKEEQITQQELANRMGTVRQNVSQSLNRGSGNGMRYGSFSKMTSALGYEIILKKI